MEIFDQVDKVLRDLEAREKRGRRDRQMVEGSMLAELTARYNQYLTERDWASAQECLQHISRLVVAMMTE